MKMQKIDPIHLLWETNENFKKQAKRLHIKYNLASNATLMEFEFKFDNIWKQDKKDDFWWDIFGLVFEYKLYGWEEELKSFIGTGNFPIQPAITPPNVLILREGIQVAFIIKKPIVKTQLKEWLDENWFDGVKLNRILREHFTFPLPAPEKHVRNINIIRRIIELKDKEGCEFHDIADKIVNEFYIDDSEGKINENSVKDMYHKYKNYAKSLQNRKLGISINTLT